MSSPEKQLQLLKQAAGWCTACHAHGTKLWIAYDHHSAYLGGFDQLHAA